MDNQKKIYSAVLKMLTNGDLTPSALKILLALASKGPMRMADLMRATAFASPNTVLMAKMVKTRLVDSLTYTENGNSRVYKYSISPMGEIALNKALNTSK